MNDLQALVTRQMQHYNVDARNNVRTVTTLSICIIQQNILALHLNTVGMNLNDKAIAIEAGMYIISINSLI